ncbi:MAG: Ribosomal large subunit pseudouridine synthase F [Candidatus Kaiserbacteria bacterium GW2011_GWB1_52_6]|uniref:Pseudouridine synthase n=2 Tax=Candidatus Kaiseribacteriota TaxID=1752734 RepID=A0A0G1ZR26_9BACT|nr:MAG: Ribosomal large subunit pseudouridine synthase F [Candidatus Kaiserbacteria bacterium GW2011_GWB1_52_6]KKW30677.1 MAG: Ribosomal large subunit pseudouridine synthase F [Candidatus Kaiserbacteria bacterium GW2011_GWC2_52_8b]
MEKEKFPMRINKYLASKKYCTRREADTLIEKGLVMLNGKRAVLGDKVQENDVVDVKFRQKKYKYYAYNKPRGVITHSPQEGEVDIASTIGLKGVFPIGRLDKDSEGLIILTDDGRITDSLLNPDEAHEKEYLVATKEELAENFKKKMESGVDIEGYMTKPAIVRVLGTNKFSIALTEGKKHQIRRMCAALGYVTARLQRRRIMNISLAGLKQGQYRPITGKSLSDFLQSLGF